VFSEKASLYWSVQDLEVAPQVSLQERLNRSQESQSVAYSEHKRKYKNISKSNINETVSDPSQVPSSKSVHDRGDLPIVIDFLGAH
jgi:hypothetical protein